MGAWPDPPRGIARLHHAFHSMPVALLGATLYRVIAGRWPTRILAAWLLHIAIDLPTHRREPWGPQFLWPISTFTFDGWSWTDALSRLIAWRQA